MLRGDFGEGDVVAATADVGSPGRPAHLVLRRQPELIKEIALGNEEADDATKQLV